MARFRVRDFGPVREGDVVLRRLTVFVGPNGTGKSYLAYLIWGLYTAEPDWGRLVEVVERFVRGCVGDLGVLARCVREALVELVVREFSRVFAGGFRRKLLDVFLVDDVSRLVRVGADSAEVVVSSDDGERFLRVVVGREGLVVDGPGGPRLGEALRGLTVSVRGLREGLAEVSVSMGGESAGVVVDLGDSVGVAVRVASLLLPVMLWLFDGYAPYVPAAVFPDSRAGILRARGALVYVLLRERRLPALVSDVDAEFLAYVERLPEGGERDERLLAVAGLVEELLGARFVADPSAPERLLVEQGVLRYGLARAPSGFRELAPLVFAMKYSRLPDLVIVEEPETHLHPDAQSVVARALAALASYAGRTVLITTHSIHIIDELSSLVRLGRLGGEERVRLGYREWEGLRPSDVAVYVFSRDGRVRPVEVSEDGIAETDLERIVIELGNKYAIIDGLSRGRPVSR